ncbi:MAG: gliding motility-associated C-terminal domain-containing protein, partial [Elusimicrobiota bacterium]
IAGMDELKLIIGYYDETIFYQRWVILPSVVYPDSNKVTGRIKHLSIFRILQLFAAANLSSVIVYPNPYKPGATGINKQFSDPLLGTGIIFSGLTSKANIKIYNIAAELVYETDETDGNGINLWNTENKDGDKVASGLYIYYITNPDDTKMKPVKGKFTIVR